jgi:uncharacterized protein (TIGR03790 family)
MCALGVVGCLVLGGAEAEGLFAARLGVIYDLDDARSGRVAAYYAAQREIPAENVIGLHVPHVAVLAPAAFGLLREGLLAQLPTSVQSLLLVWSKPYAVGCMSVTTAVAAGYHPAFCEPGCARTRASPLFDSDGWLPADTLDWFPAMLLPSDDEPLARAVVERGIAADASAPPGTLYLVRTSDPSRNVRAATYARTSMLLAHRLRIEVLTVPDPVAGDIPDAIGYFTGAVQVEELSRIRFRPGALADHLTSSGGVLDGIRQMPALAWLRQGATASYGTVSEPCNLLGKFPNLGVLFEHYRHGETALEAYWKSVAMPGQGLFIGEPLARPYAIQNP